MVYNLIFEKGFDALIELSFSEDGKPCSIMVSQITSINSLNDGGSAISMRNGKWVFVKESREEILKSIDRLQKNYTGGTLKCTECMQ